MPIRRYNSDIKVKYKAKIIQETFKLYYKSEFMYFIIFSIVLKKVFYEYKINKKNF